MELIDAQSKNKTPCTMIALKEPFCFNAKFVNEFKATLNETLLKDIVVNSQIVYSPNPCVANESETDQLLAQFYAKCHHLQQHGMNGSQWVIRLVLERNKLAALNITIKTVQKILRESLPNKLMYHMLCAEQYMPELVIRIRMCGINDGNKKDVERSEFEKNMANLFLTHLTNTIYICGISGLHHACVLENDQHLINVNGDLEKKSVYGMQVGGINLLEVWDMNVCDWKQTWSNNIIETLEVLGIEAATHLLFNEIQKVLSFDGTFISPAHVMVVLFFDCILNVVFLVFYTMSFCFFSSMSWCFFRLFGVFFSSS